MLNNKGLKKLHNAIQSGNEAMARETIDVIAFSIQDHEDFRKLLATVKPEQRKVAYETLRSRLSFKPKPLMDYIAANADYAERHKLPTYDSETGTLKPFTPARTANLCEIAQNALNDGGVSVLTCRRCTKEEHYLGDTEVTARIEAIQAGWKYETALESWLCPDCNDLAKEN